MIDYVSFMLTGHVKPYVRMTQRGKWTSKQAQQYLTSKAALAYQIQQTVNRIGQRRPLFAKDLALTVWLEFQLMSHLHRSDLDNQVKAILDAMNGLVYHDDRQVDEIIASRRIDAAELTRVKVSLDIRTKYPDTKGD